MGALEVRWNDWLKINGEFSRSDYIPVDYVYRSIPQGEVVELYQQADVMLVTPLRDGLPSCKEYIAIETIWMDA